MAKETLLHKSFFSLKRGSVIYRVFDYFKYHYFHVYYKFLYINRTFWKNMFTIISCLCSFCNLPEGISGLSYFRYVIEHIKDSLPKLENK